MDAPQLPRDMRFQQFWWESIKHAFSKAWIGALAVSGVLAILVPCARLAFTKPQFQDFFDILERYWTGWILIAVFFLILLGRLAYAPFLIYKKTEQGRIQVEKERDALREKKNAEGRAMFEACLRKIRGGVSPLKALQDVNAHELDTNDMLVQFCKDIELHGEQNPCKEIPLQQQHWLSFLKFAIGADLTNPNEYLRITQMVLELPHTIKRLSSTDDKELMPPSA